MKTRELRELTREELEQKLNDSLDELANLKIQKATHQISNPSRIKIVKREIARCHTLLKQVGMGAAGAEAES